MIKVEVVEEFTLEDFNKLKNIVRADKEEKGRLFPKDIFECNEDMADYLTGNNPVHRAVVKVIEVISEKEEKKEKAVKKTTTKKITKKSTKKE